MARGSLVRTAALSAVMLAALWTRAGASITIIPVSPSTSDTVRGQVDIYFGTMCWSLTTTDCPSAVSDTLDITATVAYCHPCVCAQYPVHLTRTCTLGPLPVGTYVVRYTELHSPGDPVSTFSEFQWFAVGAPTPARQPSWGALKLLYR
jgi:hypothetical protein